MSTPGASSAMGELFSDSRSPSPAPEPLNDTEADGVQDHGPLRKESSTRNNSVEVQDDVASNASSFDTYPALEQSQYRPNLKRKASEDLTLFAEEKAHLAGLPMQDATEISSQFAHYSVDQKLIILRIGQKRQELDFKRVIQTAKGPWSIPQTLNDKITKLAFAVMVDPALPAYLKDNKPVSLVMAFLQKYPGWGYTPAIAADDEKRQLVCTAVRDALTDIRSEIKQVIRKASGYGGPACDIGTLCTRVLNLKTGKHGIKLTKPTLQMAARFAILRKVYVHIMKEAGQVGRDYWKSVDEALEVIKGLAKKHKTSVSQIVSVTLNKDRKLFPPGNSSGAESEPLADVQYSPQDQINDHEISVGQGFI